MNPQEKSTIIAKHIASQEFQLAFFGIVKKYAITDPAVLGDVIAGYISGTISSAFLTVELRKKIKIPKEAALDLGEDIDTQLIDQIREYIGAVNIEHLVLNFEVQKSQENAESSITDLVSQIQNSTGIAITEDVLERRFTNLTLSWFRDIRDDLETRQMALRETRVGGLGFTPENADKFIKALKDTKEAYRSRGVDVQKLVSDYQRSKEGGVGEVQEMQIDTVGKARSAQQAASSLPSKSPVPSATTGSLQDIVKKMAALTPKPASGTRQAAQKSPVTSNQSPVSAPKPPVTSNQSPVASPVTSTQSPVTTGIVAHEKIIDAHKELGSGKKVTNDSLLGAPAVSTRQAAQKSPVTSNQSPASIITQAAQRLPESLQASKPAGSVSSVPPVTGNQSPVASPAPVTRAPSTRPKMADVKITPKLYGPLDELQSLTVADFRRLSSDPTEAVKKLQYKLQLLEEESMTRRAEGVKALQASPLYSAYGRAMQSSIVQGKADTTGELSAAEIAAILMLNKTLKR